MSTNITYIGKSITGRIIEIINADEQLVNFFVQKLNIDYITATFLVKRGIIDISDAQNFLNPEIDVLCPPALTLKDTDKAIERIIRAILCNEKITIFTDYDVDGATGCAILYSFLSLFKNTIDIYSPHRLNEGYGPNIDAMHSIRESGSTLVIMVDCGTTSVGPVSEANKIGLDVIIIDHHLQDISAIPEAVALINPNRLDENFKHKSIAAVAVVFLFISKLKEKMEIGGIFELHNATPPNLTNYLDLVTLGTICDIMPLTPLNRAFIKKGLEMIACQKNLGIKTLAEVAGIKTKIDVYHLGYIIGPMINASSRIDGKSLGIELLYTQDILKAREISLRLQQFNKEREVVQRLCTEEAIAHIEKHSLDSNPIIVIHSPMWHIGIIGIIASKIKDTYRKPAIVITVGKDGICKGSGRSIQGIDIGKLVNHAKKLELLINGGGHNLACGLTIDENKIEEFKQYLIQLILNLENKEDIFQRASTIKVDFIISIQAAINNFHNKIEKAAPFGHGNPKPVLAITQVKIVKVMQYEKLITFFVTDINDKHILKCIVFRNKGIGNNIADFIINNRYTLLNLVGSIDSNSNNAVMVVNDIWV